MTSHCVLSVEFQEDCIYVYHECMGLNAPIVTYNSLNLVTKLCMKNVDILLVKCVNTRVSWAKN